MYIVLMRKVIFEEDGHEETVGIKVIMFLERLRGVV